MAAVGSSSSARAQAGPGGVIHRDSVPAPALRHNMVGDPHWDRVSIYIPPSYHRNPQRRYPVLYFLHGFDADDRALIKGAYQNLNIRISMDSLVRAALVDEMIIVMPNARNAFNGSFYTNSPVTGNWEQFIVRDLVNYVDRKYRTVKSRDGRGIAGHSMGGYGALRIAMRHPEVFSAVYALSAYGLAFTDSVERNYQKNWKTAAQLRNWGQYAKAGFNTNLIMAFGAANAPDLSNPPFYVSLPYIIKGDSMILDRRIARRWSIRPMEMAPEFVSNLRRLSIMFDAGTVDGFKDIPVRANDLDNLLTSLGVPHSYELYVGGHGDQIRSRIENKVLPFFSRVLH
ncbi:MAG TPA: alpha/beta hydrolase-fold protein [Gemmatimonadaceae bacterium]|nr:alpha/beta hydrolase-fold protein [Gemmatimonadaceae bacterium]